LWPERFGDAGVTNIHGVSGEVGPRSALLAEHKPAPKVVVAVARELAGFIWATLQRPTAA
jgi:hypothetical protein